MGWLLERVQQISLGKRDQGQNDQPSRGTEDQQSNENAKSQSRGAVEWAKSKATITPEANRVG